MPCHLWDNGRQNEAARRIHARRPLTDSLSREGSRLVSNASRDGSDRELLPARRFEWERVVRRIKMRQGLKFVALALASYANTDGSRARPGRDRLANISDRTPRSVSRALVELRDLGLIERVSEGSNYGRQARADEYRLTLPSDILETIAMLDPDDGTGDTRVTRSRPEQVTPASPVHSGTGDTTSTEQVTSGTEQVTPRARSGDTSVTLQAQDNAIYTGQDKTVVIPTVTSGASGRDPTSDEQTMAEWEREVLENWHPPPPCECTNGWLGHGEGGRPIPCLRCKPHFRLLRDEGVA